MASKPAGIATSWNNVSNVIQPYFHELTGRDALRNAYAIYNEMPMMTSTSAINESSSNAAPTEGLIDWKLNSSNDGHFVLKRRKSA